MIKSTADSFINDLNKLFDDTEKDLNNLAGKAVRKAGFDLYKQFIGATPVGKYKGGTARQAWQAPDITGSRDFVSLTIRNPLVYAAPLDEGSLTGRRPWPTARERTKESGGRIYSKQAVDGITGPVADENKLDEIAEQIRTAVLGGI